MNQHLLQWCKKVTMPKINRILFLVILLLGCTGPTPAAQVRIAAGPPLAGDMEPDQTLKPSKGEFYRVRPGDTLWAIATAHNLDVEQLATWNQITKPDQLLVGHRLRIKPSSNSARSTMPRPVLNSPQALLPNQQSEKKEDDTTPKQETTIPESPNVTPLSRDNQITSLPTAPKDEDDEESSTKPTRSPPPKPAKALSKQAPSQWNWPHKGRIIGRFGQFGARHSTGIDIAANVGDSIYAAADGVVAYADQGVTGYGNMILLRHGGSFMTAYAHIDKILVKRGQSVRLGDTIALSGQTGITTSPRLHFEIRQSITPLNPLQYLPKRY